MRTVAIVAALSIASLLQQPPPGEPANRSHHLEDLTWVDAGAVMTPDTVVVLPLGAASAPHGPHLPLRTDAILARHLADRVADATPVLVAPALTYTHSPVLVEYAGTTTISADVARGVTADLARSLARHGARRSYVISTTPGAAVSVAAAARLLQAQGILLKHMDVPAQLESAGRGIRQQQNGDHAGELETSVMLYLDQSQVDVSRAVKDDSPPSRPFLLTRAPNRPGTYSPSGIWGDATLATAEKGRVLVEAVVKGILADIAALRTAPLPRAHTSIPTPSRLANEPESGAGDPGPRDACSEGDQRTIRNIGFMFAAFWRNHDAVRLAELWAELGDIRHPDGSVERMREVIMVNRMALFKQREYQTSRHTLQVGVIRCLTEDIAVADGKWELRDVFDANGQQVPAMKGLFTLVLRRGWFIESYRYTVDPVEPAGPTLLERPGYPGRGRGPGR